MKDFKEKIEKTHTDYLQKSLEVANYRMYNILTNLLIEQLDEKTITTALSKIKHEKINYSEFIKVKLKVENQNKSYDSLNIELMFRLNFQIFEEYLAELIYCCFESFPKFINKFEPKIEVPFDKIFAQDDLNEIKDYIISYRVKKIMQSNNIVEVMNKMENLFGFKFKIDKAILDILFVDGLNRNVLTHNNGVVNEIYLQALESRGLKTTLKKGESVSKIIKSNLFMNEGYDQIDLAEHLFKVLTKDASRLEAHNSKL